MIIGRTAGVETLAATTTSDAVLGSLDAVRVRELPDGSGIAEADLALPAGWNRVHTCVRFLLPVAFPAAQPDCFFADLDLRVASGAMPQNSGIQRLEGEDLLWFSWHLSTWSPSADNANTYLRFIERRLRDVR